MGRWVQQPGNWTTLELRMKAAHRSSIPDGTQVWIKSKAFWYFWKCHLRGRRNWWGQSKGPGVNRSYPGEVNKRALKGGMPLMFGQMRIEVAGGSLSPVGTAEGQERFPRRMEPAPARRRRRWRSRISHGKAENEKAW